MLKGVLIKPSLSAQVFLRFIASIYFVSICGSFNIPTSYIG